MTKQLLVLDASPTEQSSTGFLLSAAADTIIRTCTAQQMDCSAKFVQLNSMPNLIPCQSCGKAPEDEWCFYHDALTPVLDDIATADAILLGSPIYFDAVSAQAKLLIDRCNCFRPADFRHENAEYRFLKRLPRKRPGGMILVGGPEAWFEGARRCLAGWFKWIEVESSGLVMYQSADYTASGSVQSDQGTISQAEKLGYEIAARLTASKC